MSCTMHRLQWACTTEDFYDMSEREQGRAGLPDEIHQANAEQWALDGLRAAMEAAGEAFIAAHPGLFRTGLT